MNSNMVIPEKFDHLDLVYHFTVHLNNAKLKQWYKSFSTNPVKAFVSEKAYGVLAYIQTINNGNVSCLHNKRLELEASSRKLK